MSLCNLGGTPERRDEFRDVSIGYDKLAALVGGSERNVQRSTESLLRKLAIQIICAEDSGIRQGKMYRVYSMTEILRRRREVGYTWVLRIRSAVELVKMSTVHTLPPVDKLPTAVSLLSVGKATTDTVDSLSTGTVERRSTPLGTSFLGIKQETSSSADHTELIHRIQKAGVTLDDDAARRLVSRCRSADHTATIQEIAFFTQLKTDSEQNAEILRLAWSANGCSTSLLRCSRHGTIPIRAAKRERLQNTKK